MAAPEIPCIKLPELPEIPEISVFGGIKLNGFLDFSKGMPTDCSVTFSLLQQLAPLLASLKPFKDILDVIVAIKDFATNPLIKGPDLIQAIDKILGLVLSLSPAGLVITLAGILKLVVNFLDCAVAQIRVAVDYQVSLDLIQATIDADPSQDSLVIRASLSCARANAEVAMAQATGSLGPIKPLLDIVSTLISAAGLPFQLPDLSLSAGADAAATIDSLQQSIDTLKSFVDQLPG